MLFRSVAFLWGMTAVAAVDPIQVTLDWPHANSDNNSMATTSLSHYGKPPEGCGDDELVLQIQGVPGVICAPSCSFTKPCPSDLPDGVSASPQCALKDQSGHQYCILLCKPGEEASFLRNHNNMVGDGMCGEEATCQPIQGVGVCTYPLDEDNKKEQDEGAQVEMA